MAVITLTVSGELTPLELAAFLSLIRGLDKPKATPWAVKIEDPDGTTMAEAEAMLRTHPPVLGPNTVAYITPPKADDPEA